MKLLLEKMTPHSLMKKCIYSIAVLTVLLFLITGGVADNFFYLTLKPKLQHQYEVLISAAATKLSYIIHQNSQYMLQFWEDEKLCRDMMEWAQLPQTDTAGRQQVYRRVAEKLEPERRGEEEKGAIVSSRSAFTVLDGKYLFVPEEMEGCAGQIIGSDWFAALPEIFKELYDNAGVNDLPRCYSPAFSMEGQKDFLAFALMKEAEGHTFYYIMVEPLADFKNIFKDLEQANIRDYALTGYGRQILYQSREDSRLEHLKEEVWNAICSGEQYEARVAELNQGIAFGARASYRMEQLTVAAVMDRGELLSTYRNFIQSVYFFLMAFLLFFLVLAAVIMGKSLSPLRILSRQMTDARQQNWNVDRKIQRKDEIGALADSFYSMMDQLQENLRQIREQDEQKKKSNTV